jgi:hypothetical protein
MADECPDFRTSALSHIPVILLNFRSPIWRGGNR